MAPAYHPDFEVAIAPMVDAMKATPKAAVHDVATRRKRSEAAFGMMLSALPAVPGIEEKVHHVTTSDGYSLAITQYYNPAAAPSSTPTPATLYIHGGAYIALSVPIFAPMTRMWAAKTSMPFFSVEYRLAPEHPYPTPLEDCYTALQWLSSHAADFNIDNTRIAVMGGSAGGGLAAAVAIAARDRKFSPPIARQVLIYPMLDDRKVTPDPLIEPFAIFAAVDSLTAWTAYLTPALNPCDPNSDKIPPTAAPARLENFEDLPPTYIDTGDLDIFRDEIIDYASRLWKAGVQCDLQVYQGVPHGFEAIAPGIDITRRANEARVAALMRLWV